MGFAITALAFPIMLYAQLVRGLSPDPVGAAAGADGGDVDRARAVGRQAHRRGAPARDHRLRLRHARSSSLVWLAREMTPDSATWEILLPMALLGVGNAFIWAPTSATATRNLPMQPGRRRCRHLQRDPSGRRRARLGRDRGADGLPARRPGPGLRAERGRRGQPAGPGRSPRSATRWPRRCCCPPAVLVIGFLAAISFARPKHLRARRPRPATEASRRRSARLAPPLAGAAVTRGY